MCNYYESNAERYATETFSADMSEQYQRFLPLLKNGAKILDVGSGSGRDACYFQKQGYQVTALEPSKNLCSVFWRNCVFRGPELSADGTVRWDLGVCVIDSSEGRRSAAFF